eukprot:CAMPEP_0178956672 /NCGR_PEP_ID=MMETSP0789-20121207/10423_1 /TAXON_ID=3005 /ORGANISM="Rhizosolenia setigera, Strain CCMP 1694" /LENGTH=332 /DNA_ID=CAMNT_0020638705 /DNA_START=69 /DNA_END=1067 /DNA_ORIENTATION=-
MKFSWIVSTLAIVASSNADVSPEEEQQAVVSSSSSSGSSSGSSSSSSSSSGSSSSSSSDSSSTKRSRSKSSGSSSGSTSKSGSGSGSDSGSSDSKSYSASKSSGSESESESESASVSRSNDSADDDYDYDYSESESVSRSNDSADDDDDDSESESASESEDEDDDDDESESEDSESESKDAAAEYRTARKSNGYYHTGDICKKKSDGVCPCYPEDDDEYCDDWFDWRLRPNLDSSKVAENDAKYGKCDTSEFPSCGPEEKLCPMRKPRLDKFYDGDDKDMHFYIDYDCIQCVPKHENCSKCSPGLWCEGLGRCVGPSLEGWCKRNYPHPNHI